MPIVVDFSTELIEITSPTVDLAVQDLINAVRTAEASEEGIAYGKIADASGKEDLGSGVSVGISLELLGNWQVHFWSGNYIAKIAGGNLVGGPSGDPVAYSAGVQVLLIQSAASTIVVSGDGGFTAADRTALESASTNATAIRATTDELGSKSAIATTVVGAIWAATVDTSKTFGQAMKRMLSVLAGAADISGSDANKTVVYKDQDGATETTHQITDTQRTVS